MTTEPRQPMVAGNWKMHLLRREAQEFCHRLLEGLEESPVRVALFPSFPLIADAVWALKEGPVTVGGQDLHPEAKGAHTGDVSALQLIDAGCTWALCGHSERRGDHGESDELVARKADAAMTHGLTPMICLGETAEERAAGQTFDVLTRQLHAVLSVIEPAGEFAFAYEPVWAIGTGETATPEIAQEAHAHLRAKLTEALGPESAAWVTLLYGGSVNPSNAADLIVQPDVDGFLVGGASLDPEKFLTIIHHVAAAWPEG